VGGAVSHFPLAVKFALCGNAPERFRFTDRTPDRFRGLGGSKGMAAIAAMMRSDADVQAAERMRRGAVRPLVAPSRFACDVALGRAQAVQCPTDAIFASPYLVGKLSRCPRETGGSKEVIRRFHIFAAIGFL
jgi:hypothetical protein